MSPGVDFLDDAPGEDRDEPPRRRRRWPLVLGVAALAAVAIAAVAGQDDGPATPTTQLHDPLPSSTQPQTQPQTSPPPDPTVERVYRWATGNLITDADFSRRCATVPARTDARIVHVISRVLPAYRVRDSSTVDLGGRTCAAQVRAIDTHGSTLVVSVTAARGRDGIGSGDALAHGSRVSYLRLTSGGRTVLAGSTGRDGPGVGVERLMRIVIDPTLSPPVREAPGPAMRPTAPSPARHPSSSPG